MIEALSTSRSRFTTLILWVICGFLAIIATSLGIDDNPPGIVLAFLAATAFILAFVHPWRTARQFMLLLLAAVISLALFVILNIILDSAAQNPATSSALQKLLQSSLANALNIIFAMLCASALVVGVVGAVVMFIRSRRHQKPNG